ncbi:MAG: glycosyl transferase, partial [Specibacter sp.]
FNREVLRGAGRYFASALDVMHLAEAAEADPATARFRGRLGRQRASDYDWDDVADRYEELCTELADGSLARPPAHRREAGNHSFPVHHEARR